MRYHRLLLFAAIGMALVLSAGCYVRMVGPPLFVPVPVPIGGGGYYGHPEYYGHGEGR
jgi:hypothetical protein